MSTKLVKTLCLVTTLVASHLSWAEDHVINFFTSALLPTRITIEAAAHQQREQDHWRSQFSRPVLDVPVLTDRPAIVLWCLFLAGRLIASETRSSKL